ncbi:MAG TPA: glucose-1-phosphate adenylyltransferase [Chloroflexi bacterium]|nr:glucose-1-phosphate adenylyltransferase [Chloroflexota bacterium]
MKSLDNVLALILGGGRGTRLWPLTQQRSKPAVPIAGKYRLIDIPISNCINSGLYRIAVLTQFNSVSLHRHIARTYFFDAFHVGWVQIWAAEQTMATVDWYQGTADAVRKQLRQIRSTHAEYTLILAGDHLYRMDFRPMIEFHLDCDAEITVAVQPVLREDAGRFGLLKRTPEKRITDFAEKPTDPAVLERMVSRDDPARPFLGSMGIYLFKTSVLHELLENSTHTDFGGQVLPEAITSHRVFGYDVDDYWEDIGTIRSFYETNLALAQPDPPFNFFDPQRPIYTHARFLPGSTIQHSRLENVLVAEGCCLINTVIRNSVIGLRSQVRDGSEVVDTVMMGSDDYDDYSCRLPGPEDPVPMGIGRSSYIEGAILDKNVRIGMDVQIRPFPRGTDLDRDRYVVRDGIVVIPKNTLIPNGTRIGPE